MGISERIKHIEQLIRQAEILYHRQPGSVKLLAVSKGHSSTDIQQALAAGLRDFGENYLQEALTKILALPTLPINWHFIGPIQSNKTASIAQYFSWVHSISRPKIARLLNDMRPISMPPLNICLQVNFDDEETKAGLMPHEVEELASYVQELPRLQLRGLMIIPKPQACEQMQYQSLLRLTQLMDTLNQKLGLQLDTLSMGMSDDLQAAIHAGSTIVRVGTAIFGERKRIIDEH
jgi:hypothetical protein